MNECKKPLHIINFLAKQCAYQTYLEIGLQHAEHNFNLVAIPTKHSVDIQARWEPTFAMSSDDFFEQGHGLPKYDCIYVDADHRELPSLRDLGHAVQRLAPNGTILCDNLLPLNDHGMRCYANGEAWKAWSYLRMSRPDLRMAVISMAFGCGVIRFGAQQLFVPEEQPYKAFKHDPPVDRAFYFTYRDPLLNVISPEEFPEWIK